MTNEPDLGSTISALEIAFSTKLLNSNVCCLVAAEAEADAAAAVGLVVTAAESIGDDVLELRGDIDRLYRGEVVLEEITSPIPPILAATGAATLFIVPAVIGLRSWEAAAAAAAGVGAETETAAAAAAASAALIFVIPTAGAGTDARAAIKRW